MAGHTLFEEVKCPEIVEEGKSLQRLLEFFICSFLSFCYRIYCMKILLIHGFKSNSKMNFFPWLREELIKLGHDVIVPNLPNANEPDPEEWVKTLLEAVKTVDDETVVVGHSLGAATALRFLEAVEVRSTCRGAVLIAAPWMIRDEKLRGFFMSELDFDVLMWKASKFTIIHSHDDPVIPFDHAEKYAKVLHANLIERNDGEEHFQGERYPTILKAIQGIVGEEIVYEPGKSLDDEYAQLHER
jgi:uncharacterized protein